MSGSLRDDGPAALEWAARYLERVDSLPVLAQVAPGEIRARLPERAPETGEPFSAVLRDLDEVLLPGVTHWQHPRFFAYFATSVAEPAILAEMLAATLNSVAFLWRTAPAATELESVVLDWVADLLGLPAGWHGHIEDTASISTLAAIIAAREATGRRVVGPYRPIGQPSGTTAQGVTRQGKRSARRTSQVLHSGSVINAAPRPAARAASSRFCTEG